MHIRRTAGDFIFDTLNAAFFVVLGLIMLLPLWNVLMISLVTMGEFFSRSVIVWPREPTLTSYRYIFGHGSEIFTSLRTTVILTVVGSCYSLTVTTALSYGLSKKRLPGRGFFLLIITITMFFSGGLIPYYLLIKSLGLMNRFAVLFVPTAVSTWNFIVIKSFFSQLPLELEEAATIDGCTDVGIFVRIVLPLSKPVLATFLLFYAVGYWSSWWPATLFLQTRYFTLQFVLRKMLVENVRPAAVDQAARAAGKETVLLFDEGIKMATVMVATVPIICVYPFLQKHFAKGVMIGSIKG